jgi:hypothetical protein
MEACCSGIVNLRSGSEDGRHLGERINQQNLHEAVSCNVIRLHIMDDIMLHM